MKPPCFYYLYTSHTYLLHCICFISFTHMISTNFCSTNHLIQKNFNFSFFFYYFNRLFSDKKRFFGMEKQKKKFDWIKLKIGKRGSDKLMYSRHDLAQFVLDLFNFICRLFQILVILFCDLGTVLFEGYQFILSIF